MKKLLFLFLLAGCTAKETQQQEPVRTPDQTTKPVPQVANTPAPEYFSLFKEVSFDTLHIYSNYTDNGEMELKGIEIPAKYYPELPKQVQQAATQNGMGPTYACYRFAYGPGMTALIVNAPSEYDATAYDLYLYSHAAQKIVYTQRIADQFGDAGYQYLQDAWLYKANKDQWVDIVNKVREISPIDEALTKFDTTYQTTVYLGKATRFDSTSSTAFNTQHLKVHTFKKK
jgi:hypothetical protein